MNECWGRFSRVLGSIWVLPSQGAEDAQEGKPRPPVWIRNNNKKKTSK